MSNSGWFSRGPAYADPHVSARAGTQTGLEICSTPGYGGVKLQDKNYRMDGGCFDESTQTQRDPRGISE